MVFLWMEPSGLLRQPPKQLLRLLRNQLAMQISLGILSFVLAGSLRAHGQGVQVNPTNQTPPGSQSSSTSIKPYHSITTRQRLSWFLDSTVGLQTLTVGLVNPGIGTARDEPPEYGSHWAGYGKRYGIGLSGVATGNAMEASIGALWGEDPRYFRTYRQPFAGRVRNVVVMTFLAHNREGALMPAYARYTATAGSNFLSNTWRADSEANTGDALLRTLYGFGGLMAKDAFIEFWPDVKRLTFHRNK
jgi:hypothetical protein